MGADDGQVILSRQFSGPGQGFQQHSFFPGKVSDPNSFSFPLVFLCLTSDFPFVFIDFPLVFLCLSWHLRGFLQFPSGSIGG